MIHPCSAQHLAVLCLSGQGAMWVGVGESVVKNWKMLACIKCTCSLYAFSMRVWLLYDDYSYMYVLVQVAPWPINSFNNRSDHAT
jgi:hypothetical protein